MSNAIVGAPNEVALVYRQVGSSHVFTAKSAPGLHVGSSDLERAFDNALEGLGQHFTRLYGRQVSYQAEVDSAEFARRLSDGDEGLANCFVFARLTEGTREAA